MKVPGRQAPRGPDHRRRELLEGRDDQGWLRAKDLREGVPVYLIVFGLRV